MATPDILITPGAGTIAFTGSVTGTMQLRVAESGALHFEGDQGSLLTITDDLSDSLFSVNDAAGMPVFEVFADDTIKSYRNNETKLEIDPDNNRIRLRDNTYISGNLIVSGDVTSSSATHESTSYTSTADITAGTHVSGLSGYFGKLAIGTQNDPAGGDLDDGTIVIGNGEAGHGKIRLHGYTSSPGNYHQIWTDGDNLYMGRNAANHLFMQYNGNIGIGGTTSPVALLDVRGSLAVGSASTAAGSALAVNGDVGITGELSVNADIYMAQYIKHMGDTDTFFGFGGNDSMVWRTAGTNRMTLDNWTLGVTGELKVYNHIRVRDGYNVGNYAGTLGMYGVDASNLLKFQAGGSPKFAIDTTATQVTGQLRVAGDVGIGVLTPQAKLQVNGDASITGELRVAGDVGIGCAPNANLEIEDGGSSHSVLLKVTADDQGPYALMVGNDTYSATDTDGIGMWINNAGQGKLHTRGTNSQLILGAAGTNYVYILSDGNVGIGTSTPSTLLHLRPSSDPSIADYTPLQFDHGWAGLGDKIGLLARWNSIDAWKIYGQADAGWSTSIHFANHDGSPYTLSDKMVILGGGNVGIGTSVPSGLLNLRTTTTNTQLTIQGNAGTNSHPFASLIFKNDRGATGPYPGQAGIIAREGADRDKAELSFFTASDSVGNTGEVMRIGMGKVGIGTASPEAELHVYTADNQVSKFQSSDNLAMLMISDDGYSTYVGTDDDGSLGATNISFIGGTASLDAGNLNIRDYAVGVGNWLETENSTAGTYDLHEVDGGTITAELRVGLKQSNGCAVLRLANYGSSDDQGGGEIIFTNTRLGSALYNSDLAAIKGARESLGKGYLKFYTAGPDRVGFGSSSGNHNEKMRIDSDGHVLIGAGAGASALLTVSGDASITGELKVAGNVGIGTNAPTYELDVQGNIGLNEYIYHNDDTDTYMQFQGDSITFKAGGDRLLGISENPLIGDTAVFVNIDGPGLGKDCEFRVHGKTNYDVLRVDSEYEVIGIGLDKNAGYRPTGKLHIYQSGDAIPAFLVEGSQGSLFSVEDSLTGSLMSVNDIAGLPVFEAFDDGTIVMGQYNSGDFTVTGNSVDIGGNLTIGGRPGGSQKAINFDPTNLDGGSTTNYWLYMASNQYWRRDGSIRIASSFIGDNDGVFGTKLMVGSTTHLAGTTLGVDGDVGITGELRVLGHVRPNGIVMSATRTAGAGIGGAAADENSFEIGPGYVNFNRDDTANAKQIQFSKNGAVHSYLETTIYGLNIGGANRALGLGTQQPDDKLHVVGNVFIEDSSPEITFETTSASHSNWQIAAQEWNSQTLQFAAGSTDADASNDTFSPKLTIESGGDVGIGIATPDSRLHIVSTTLPILKVAYNTDHYLGIGHSYIDLRYTSYTNNFDFRIGGQAKMAISRVNGGVAIDPALPGEFLPTGALHVNHYGTGIIVANNQITGNAFEVYGAQGNLLTITDDLSDSLMSVNDAAGMPVFEVFADDTIKSYRNNESKFEVDPDNNRIRLRDNVYVSGQAIITGSVGIGTTSPSYKLDVYGAGEISAAVRSSDNNALLVLKSASSVNSYIRFQDNAERYWIHSKSNNSLLFRPAGTSTAANQIVFDQNGKVGIGTTIPQANLAVNGDASITGKLTVDNIEIQNGTTAGRITSRISSGYPGLEFNDQGGAGGDLSWAIGANDRGGANAPGQNAFLFRCRNGGARFTDAWYTEGTEVMTLDDAGRVGIGTVAPTAKLQVDGSAIFNEGGIDADFRVESDNAAEMFFIDGGNNIVGIGAAPNRSNVLLELNTLNNADAFIAFDGTSASNETAAVQTTTSSAGHVLQGYVRVLVNNATRWIACYD